MAEKDIAPAVSLPLVITPSNGNLTTIGTSYDRCKGLKSFLSRSQMMYQRDVVSLQAQVTRHFEEFPKHTRKGKVYNLRGKIDLEVES